MVFAVDAVDATGAVDTGDPSDTVGRADPLVPIPIEAILQTYDAVWYITEQAIAAVTFELTDDNVLNADCSLSYRELLK